MIRRAPVLALALALLSLASIAHAQQPPRRAVTLTADGVFGPEALLGDGYDALSITATNNTTATLRGHVEVAVRQWQQPEQVVEMPLDLPGNETRRAIVTIFVTDSAAIEARYVVDGGGASGAFSTSVTASYGQSARALVVLADPPRLRGALLDLTTNVRTPAFGYGGGGTTASGVPLGLVAFDARTGDPVLPTSALGWSSVAVLAASAPTLGRLSADQLDALEGWLHAGGRMVLFPRTDADLGSPFVRTHFPEVRRDGVQERVDGQAPIVSLTCGAAHRERFGCSTRVGFGALYLADFDGAAPPYVELPSTRAIVSAIVDQANGGFDPVASTLTYGRRTDETADSYGYYGSAQRLSFGRLRAALDPNEGYRPALALIGIVLFLYVLLVGPLNFWWVGRKKTPTLALLTTPALALACAAVMFFVGYLGKGVIMRYRRVEIVEAVEGDSLGVARRYTGYYFTRPSSMQTDGPDDGGVYRLLGGSGGVVHQGDARPTLRDVSGSLWETVFTREEHEVALGQGVTFTLDDRRLAAVHNGTTEDLHGAFVVDAAGNVYVVGELAAGASADIPRDASLFLPTSGFYDVTSSEVGTLRDALGLAPSESAYALGIARLLGSFPAGLVPVLYARGEPEGAPTASPSFAVERDLRILRIVPNLAVPDLYLSTGTIAEVTPPTDGPRDPSDPLGDALQGFFGATDPVGGASR